MDKQEFQTSWFYFLSIEKDLAETSRYIEPSGQANAYSFEFYKIILLACAEVEATLKKICVLVDPGMRDKKNSDMKDYQRVLLKEYPRICESVVFVPRWNNSIFPLAGWEATIPAWWEAYRELKHNRLASIQKASYENAVNALGALYILLLYLQKITGLEFCGKTTQYLESDYFPQLLLARSPSELPDFATELD